MVSDSVPLQSIKNIQKPWHGCCTRRASYLCFCCFPTRVCFEPSTYGKSCIGCTEIGGLAPVMRWITLTTLKPRLASQVTLHSALEEPSQKWCGLWIWCSCWLECGPKDTWLGRRDQVYYALSRQSCVGVMLSFWCHGSRMADAQLSSISWLSACFYRKDVMKSLHLVRLWYVMVMRPSSKENTSYESWCTSSNPWCFWFLDSLPESIRRLAAKHTFVESW